MTHRNRSPKNAANSPFNFRPAGHPISQLMLLWRASTEYVRSRWFTCHDTQSACSMMYEPSARPMMTSLATSHSEL